MLSKRKREFAEHLLCKEDTGYSDAAFAEMIGVSAKTVHRWASDPEFVAVLEQMAKELSDTKSVFGAKTYIWTVEEALVQYKAAEGAEKRHWWKLINSMTEEAGGSTRVDYSQWADDDLEAEWSRRGLSETEAAIEAAKGALA